MLFTIEPKDNIKDLFGMEYELELFIRYLKDDSVRMIVIKGLRRTGKTSLLNVALKEAKVNYVKIDVRESPYYDHKEFMMFLIKKIKNKIDTLWDKIIKTITKIKVRYEKFSFELFFSKKENIAIFFETLNKQLEKKKKKLILAFDEAQFLKNIKFDYFLASIYDNYKNIKLILSGSEIGLLDKFLGKKDYNAPLYGRAYLEINTKKLTKDDAMRFLKIGFKEIRKEITFEEIREVIENLDGIIGWISYYGWFRWKGLNHKESLEKVKEEGSVIIKKELEEFLRNRKSRIKYIKILKAIIKGYNDWFSIKNFLSKEGIMLKDNQLNFYLKEMIDYSIIEKINNMYFITDPLINISRIK